MRPITPRMRAELGAPDSPHRPLLEAQAEQRSSSKKTKTDFQTADTYTARTADFTASNSLTAAGNTVAAALASAPAANALYEAHFKVSINTTVPASSSNTLKITVSVETDPTGAAVWTEQFSFDYEVTRKTGEPAVAVIWDHERLPVRVTGFTGAGQLRLKLKSLTGPGTVSVHGFNAATNADITSGVTYHTGPAVDFLDSGQGVTLADTVISKISHATNDAYQSDLGGPPQVSAQSPYIVARIVWGKDDSVDIAIDRIKAYLNPCVDGVPGNKNVTWWYCQVFGLSSAYAAPTGFPTYDQAILVPICDPVRIPAGDGTTAQDYTFSWHERNIVGPGHTIITLGRKPRPKSIRPTFPNPGPIAAGSSAAEYESSSTSYIFVWALQSDGTAATNVGWGSASGTTEVVNGSRRLRAIQARFGTEVRQGFPGWIVESISRGAATRPEYRMDVQCGSYAAANLEFTGANLLDLGAAPTETVEFVGLATTVGGSVFEVRNDADAAWLTFTDGQTAAEVGVSQRQTYKVRWRATPNTETDGTPTLFEIGVRDVKRVWLSDIATVRAKWAIPDLSELVPAIPEFEIVVQKSGEQDFLDRMTVLLSENYVGSLMFRIWVGDISRPRSEWVHKDDGVLVDDYDPRAADVTVLAHSPLVLLNGALPVFSTTTQQRLTLRLANKTPTQVWDEIIGVQLATDVSTKYRGDVSALGSSVLLTKNITDSNGKRELDAIAHIAGCVLGSSRGKIAAFDMFTPGGIVAVFPAEKITWKSTSPGLRQRVPELFAKYDYQDETQNYRGEARVITVDANTLTRMGGTARIDANRNLRDEVCRWLPNERIAKTVAQRRVNALGTGMLLWRFTSTDPYPELEFGDRVAVETTQFMARDPTLGTLRALKGALWAIGRVVEYDVEGRELAIWIQGYTDILGAGSSAAVRLGLGLPGPLGQNFTQMLTNPGYEDGPVLWAANGGSIAVVTDSTKAHTGNNYLQVTSTTGVAANGVAADNTGGPRYFEVSPGDVVQWGGYPYRESGTANVTFYLETFDKDKVFVAIPSIANQNTAAYVFTESQYIVPAGVKFIRFNCSIDSSGVATVARFDDVYLRMAVADSTVLNPQSSVLPVPFGAGLFTGSWGGIGAGQMFVAFSWASQTLLKPDGSSVTLPAPPAALAAPTLTQQAGGVRGATTLFARIGLFKDGHLEALSAESSLAVLANNVLKIASPTNPGGYDQWMPLVGSASNAEYVQASGAPPNSGPLDFGTGYVEPNAHFTTIDTQYAAAMLGALVYLDLQPSTTYYFYPFYDSVVGFARFAPFGFAVGVTAPSMPNANQAWSDGRIALSGSGMTIVVGGGGGSGSPTTGGSRLT